MCLPRGQTCMIRGEIIPPVPRVEEYSEVVECLFS